MLNYYKVGFPFKLLNYILECKSTGTVFVLNNRCVLLLHLHRDGTIIRPVCAEIHIITPITF